MPERDAILALARAVAPHAAMVKLGLEGYVMHGPDVVRALRDLGVEVFLDLKLHDIPRTVAAAAAGAGKLGVRLLTVHAQGGAEMVRAAREELPDETRLVAVTVLTSLDDVALGQMGLTGGALLVTQSLGKLALASGADGLVCSAHELQALSLLGGLRVVPGIRPAGAAAGDQKRVATPRQAVQAGATFIVVGRPITGEADPAAAAARIVQELEGP